jgi:DNA-binding response OmpR family regulator
MAKRIFVVDDEKCIADTLAVILRQSGYEASSTMLGVFWNKLNLAARS